MHYSDMLPHQQRVVDELVELNGKISSLADFIDESRIFKTLDPEEKMRLLNQHYHMNCYSDILEKRIAHFGG